MSGSAYHPDGVANDGITDVFLGIVVHLTSDPWAFGDAALEVWRDGALVVRDGRVVAVGDAESVLAGLTKCRHRLFDHRGCFIVPGFIDSHLHFPQTEMIASHGAQLLEWLEKYTFPAELKFVDREFAQRSAEFFLDQLLINGTTTAMVYTTVHAHSADALFGAAQRRNMRLITGKVMMDRNCPDGLKDTPQQSYDESLGLIEKWHGRGRLSYAVTPRFAPTSSDLQLELAGKLFNLYDDLFLQSHVAENRAEVDWVAQLFPWSRSYLDVYDRYGMLGPRAVYGHCIYLDDIDRQRMRDSGTVAAFCPTSNLFLGSGLFDLAQAKRQGVTTSLATDVGGGTSFSMLATADEAYKVAQLCGGGVVPLTLFYEMTLGGARALSIDQFVGNFEAGKEADFVVLDAGSNSLLERRLAQSDDIIEQLFALMVLGDRDSTVGTWLLGQPRYQRGGLAG